ncbi:MAG: hypothetical protein HQK60_15610 [Deltaproteobacteria bacterium]|nr:hypothetical protein [Deltaproteobacteria bacterium]
MLLRSIGLVLFLLVNVGQLQAQVASGDYEGLLIGIDPAKGTITGYYENYTGLDEASGQPLFSCIFYLRGSMKGAAPYKIQTWFPADKTPDNLIAGELTPAPVEVPVSLKIKLDQEHGGCWNVQHFAKTGGADFPLNVPGKWLAIRVVSARKAPFYAEADDGKKRKAYVVRGNPIKVYKSKPGWVFAEYTAEGKTTSGWIKEIDLFSADPPAR